MDIPADDAVTGILRFGAAAIGFRLVAPSCVACTSWSRTGDNVVAISDGVLNSDRHQHSRASGVVGGASTVWSDQRFKNSSRSLHLRRSPCGPSFFLQSMGGRSRPGRGEGANVGLPPFLLRQTYA